MRYLFCLFMLLCSVTVFSQIKTLEVVEDKVAKPVPVYDATVNYLPEKDLEQYIGQVFYLAKVTDKTGYYRGSLYVENPKKKKNAPPLIEATRLLDNMGKYYDVVGVEDINTYALHRYLLLKDKEDGAVYYYRYAELKMFFPFVVVSYFEKMNKKMVGDTLYFKGSDTNGYSLDEKEMKSLEMASFVCTDYMLDETGKNWKEVLLLESDSMKLKMPMERAIRYAKSDMEFNSYKRSEEYKKEMMKFNAEMNQRRKAEIELTFSEAKKLIGTTIYNYYGFFKKADSIDAENGPVTSSFYVNTPFKVIHVGNDPLLKNRAVLYFTDAVGQLYMQSVCFHSESDYDYFDNKFSRADIRKQHKNISEKNWDKIKRGWVEIGMTMEECKVANGRPKSISSFTTTNGDTTVWRYYKESLYFRNGILVAVED